MIIFAEEKQTIAVHSAKSGKDRARDNLLFEEGSNVTGGNQSKYVNSYELFWYVEQA